MIYTPPFSEREPADAIKKKRFKTLPECRRATEEKSVLLELPVINKIDKDKDSVLEYVTDWATTMYAEKPMSNYYKVKKDNNNYYIECSKEKRKFHYIKGFLQVGKQEYIALQKPLLPFFILLFVLLLGTMLLFIFPKDEEVIIGFGNKVELEENSNVIDLDAIPEDTEEIDMTQDMAYISGQSITKVKSNYPNVYLKNDKQNDKYTLIYEVYVNGSDTYSYKTGSIPADAAEPWDAYNCKEIKIGKNDVVYEVYVYDKEGFNVAQTTLTGLTIIKE